MSELKVIVNGHARTVRGPVTAQGLLEHLDLDPRGVVVEINERIIRRPHLEETSLADGDRVEVVHFVGGG